VYFNEIASDGPTKYIPRSIQIDLEDGVCNRVCAFQPIIICYACSLGIQRSVAARWVNFSILTLSSPDKSERGTIGQKDVRSSLLLATYMSS
jgi:hypothetical protein